MNNALDFDENKCKICTKKLEEKTVTYRMFEHIPYVTKPVVKDVQRLNIYVPEEYYQGKEINGYLLDTAPIFLPNSVGGYMEGPIEYPDMRPRNKGINSLFLALQHGYVVVSAGIRGRKTKDENGICIGNAPADICDLKAVVRYLRHNCMKIPGDINHIISNGTSAGGALSALLGTAGNHPDYEPYLEDMGAAKEEDHIFAASCYCPITDLDHADIAYEWEFNGLGEYQKWIGIGIEPEKAVMTKEQEILSEKLKVLFPEYVNALGLVDEKGERLTLDSSGDGTFKDYIKRKIMESAQKAIDHGVELSALKWISIQNGIITDIDYEEYIQFRTRLKGAPAFDDVALGTPENELFGSAKYLERHFTDFSKQHSFVAGAMAENEQIKLMNAMCYIEDKKAKKAEHFRIRHGSIDRDTSLSVSAILSLKLKKEKIDTDHFYPWGIMHDGDYDIEELFYWIDKICIEK